MGSAAPNREHQRRGRRAKPRHVEPLPAVGTRRRVDARLPGETAALDHVDARPARHQGLAVEPVEDRLLLGGDLLQERAGALGSAARGVGAVGVDWAPRALVAAGQLAPSVDIASSSRLLQAHDRVVHGSSTPRS